MLLCMFGISKFVYASMILDNNAEKNYLFSLNKYFVKSIYSVSLHVHVLENWFHGIFVKKLWESEIP